MEMNARMLPGKLTSYVEARGKLYLSDGDMGWLPWKYTKIRTRIGAEFRGNWLPRAD